VCSGPMKKAKWGGLGVWKAVEGLTHTDMKRRLADRTPAEKEINQVCDGCYKELERENRGRKYLENNVRLWGRFRFLVARFCRVEIS
jgi:hypothetical protein